MINRKELVLDLLIQFDKKKMEYNKVHGEMLSLAEDIEACVRHITKCDKCGGSL